MNPNFYEAQDSLNEEYRSDDREREFERREDFRVEDDYTEDEAHECMVSDANQGMI